MMLRLLAIAALLASAMGQTQAPKGSHAIRGQIVDDLTGRPVTDVELTLENFQWQSAADPVTPDAEGKFVFSGLGLGKYALGASRPDFGLIYFDELSDDGWIQTIDVRPGDGDKTVVFRLPPRGLATGVIRDEFGDPVVGAAVTMSRQAWTEKGLAVRQVYQSSSDDRGLYRFANVPSGSYVICAKANNMGSVAAPSSSVVDFQSRSSTQYHVRSCYPQAAALPQAALRIDKGEHVTVDFTLTPAAAFRVRGHVLTASPVSGGGVLLAPDSPLQTGETWQAQVNFGDGSFEFRGIPPGPYRLEANLGRQTGGTSETLRASRHIDVESSDLDNVELAADRTAELEVVLQDTEGRTPDPNVVNLGLQSVSPDGVGMIWMLNTEGSLRFMSVPAGTYWLLTRSLEAGDDTYCVQSVKLGDVEALHGKLTVLPGTNAKLRVLVSKRCGEITGRVRAKSKLLPDAKLLLLLSGTSKDPGDAVTYFTDDRGEFTIPGLPFGRYRLWAWKVEEAKSFFGPSTLADADKYATVVDVSNDEPLDVEITALQPPGTSR